MIIQLIYFGYYNLMKKTQIDFLHQPEAIDINHPLLAAPPKTPQHHFLLTYLALQFVNNNQEIPIIGNLLTPLNGSFSQFLLQLQYMKKCMNKGALLDNPNFHILNMLILWMTELQKIKENPNPNLLCSILVPNPTQLLLHQYQELIVYFNYIAADVQKIIKSASEVDPDDLLQLLEVLLPRVYYNIILTLDTLGQESDKNADILFYNQQTEYFIRTNHNYRSLCKSTLKHLFKLNLKQNQMRDLVERACRYYLLFWRDSKHATQLFMTAFEKATEAARFSLTDQFVLFFKVINKMGDNHLQKMIRSKYEWIDNLLGRYGANSVVGHPKGEVNPFNALGIKQSIRVESRKTAFRIIQIYNEYSLFYFKVDIQNLDISIRLYYLGDFQSKVEVKKLLLTQQKVELELRSAFIAAKKGLYMIEFDNTYSWINGKNIKFEYVILSQYKEYEYPKWMNRLFEIREKGEEGKGDSSEINQRKLTEESKTTQGETERRSEQKISSYFESSEQNQAKEEEIVQPFDSKEKKRLKNQNAEVIPSKEQTVSQQHSSVPVKQKFYSHNEEEIYEQEEFIEPPKTPETHKVNQNHQTVQKHQENQGRESKEESKIQIVEIKSSQSLQSQSQSQQNQKLEWGQANLSLIDSIFSLLVNIEDHTYEFETNLEDRIAKRLRSYCEGKDRLHWIFNSEARDWLKKRNFIIATKNGITLLHTPQSQIAKGRASGKSQLPRLPSGVE